MTQYIKRQDGLRPFKIDQTGEVKFRGRDKKGSLTKLAFFVQFRG